MNLHYKTLWKRSKWPHFRGPNWRDFTVSGQLSELELELKFVQIISYPFSLH